MTWFFHIRDADDLILDPEGVELANLDGARQEALRSLHLIGAEGLRHNMPIDVREIEIANQAGETLATVRFEGALKLLG